MVGHYPEQGEEACAHCGHCSAARPRGVRGRAKCSRPDRAERCAHQRVRGGLRRLLPSPTRPQTYSLGAGDGSADDAALDAIPDEFDSLALSAEGEVGERIAAVAGLLQDTPPMVMSTQPDEHFAALEAVQRACDAEGFSISIATWK